jgi:hypothetical protein
MNNNFVDKLPTLARKAYDRQSKNQYVDYHNDMIQEILTRNLLKPAAILLLQLKPAQRIQYVMLEELQYREEFLEIGLIKETKKGGMDTYVVPKGVCYSDVEG